MKALILVLSLLLTTNGFAASPTSAKAGPRSKRKGTRGANLKEARLQLEALETKAQALGISVRFDIDSILSGMKPGIARKVSNQAKELKQALEKNQKELLKNEQVRIEVEVVLQAALDALSTRSEYAKATRSKEDFKQKDDLANVKDVLGVLNNALNIARAKVEDPENTSRDDMVTLFQKIAGFGSGAANVIAQARAVVESINNMGKSALEIRRCK